MRLLLLALMLAMTACTALRQGEVLQLGDGEVRAFGLVSRNSLEAGLIIDDLAIDLHKATPFVIVFPDGYRVRSSEITTSVLNQHSLPVVTEGSLQIATWRQHDAVGWYLGRHWYAMFFVGDDGIAKSLHLSACGHEKPGIFESVDGKGKYGFPMTKDNLQELFGLPASTLRIDVIWAFSCL